MSTATATNGRPRALARLERWAALDERRDRDTARARQLKAQGQTYRQIAEAIGVALGTVHGLLSGNERHRAALRRAALGDLPGRVAAAQAIVAEARALRATGLTVRQTAEALSRRLGRPVKEGTLAEWLRRGVLPGLHGFGGVDADPAPPSRAAIRARAEEIRSEWTPPPWHGPRPSELGPADRTLRRASRSYARLCKVLDREAC